MAILTVLGILARMWYDFLTMVHTRRHGMNDQERQEPVSMADRPPNGKKRPGRLADTEQVVVDKAGRLVVPAKFRRALGIWGRTELVASLQGDSIRLRTVDAALDRLRGIAMRKRATAGRPSGNAVEAFIAGRGGDAEKE